MSEFTDRISEMLRGAVSSGREAMPQPEAAPDQMGEISNRLLKTLQERADRARGPDLGVGLASAFGYAPEMQAIRKTQDDSALNNEKLMYDLLKSERDFAATQSENRRKSTLDILKLAVERGDKNADMVLKTIRQYTPDEADQHVVANSLNDLPDNVDATNVGQLAPRLVAQLAAEGKIKRNKTSSGTSAFERTLKTLLDSGEIDEAEYQSRMSDYNKMVAGGGMTGMERRMNRMNELLAKQRTGLSPEETQELRNLQFVATRLLNQEGIGIQAFGPPNAMAGQPSSPGVANPPQLGAANPPQATVPPMGAPRTVSPAMPKPLPDKVQEELIGSGQLADAMDVMDKNAAVAGTISGRVAKAEVALGQGALTLSKRDYDSAIEFLTAEKATRAMTQLTIPGVPSKVDQEVFDALSPGLGLSEEVNRSRIASRRRILARMVAMRIGFYKNLNYEIPEGVELLSERLGVDARAVRPLTARQVDAGIKALNSEMRAMRAAGPDDKKKVGTDLGVIRK